MFSNVKFLSIARRFYSGYAGKTEARKYVLTKHFQGEPKKSDFEIVQEELPELKDGGIYFHIFTY